MLREGKGEQLNPVAHSDRYPRYLVQRGGKREQHFMAVSDKRKWHRLQTKWLMDSTTVIAGVLLL